MGGGHENVRFEACFPSSGAILRVGRASEPELTLTRVNHVKLQGIRWAAVWGWVVRPFWPVCTTCGALDPSVLFILIGSLQVVADS